MNIPKLTANDMCRGMYEDGERKCLAGWLNHVFINNDYFPATRLLSEECGLDVSIVTFNDNMNNSLEKLADTWNTAMAKLGHD